MNCIARSGIMPTYIEFKRAEGEKLCCLFKFKFSLKWKIFDTLRGKGAWELNNVMQNGGLEKLVVFACCI